KRGSRRTKRSSSAPRDGGPEKAEGHERRKRAPSVRSALGWVACAALAVAAALSVALMVVYPSRHGPGSGREVELAVPGDESVDAVAARLAAAGLVSSPHLFALYLRVRGGTDHVARGTHLLTDDLSPGELLARLE